MFIRVCVGSHGCCRGHSGSPVFTAAHLDVDEFILVRVRSLHRGRRVHSVSRGFTEAGSVSRGFPRARLEGVVFIQDHVCSFGRD